MEAIKVVGLTKKYKDLTAVDSLDLSIGQGELFSLLGVNGAGKTTTIKMLSCLAKPTSGNAFLCGKSIVFKQAACLLPFVHAVKMEQAVISGNYAQIFPHIFWVLGCALVILAAAVFAFLRQMKRQ